MTEILAWVLKTCVDEFRRTQAESAISSGVESITHQE